MKIYQINAINGIYIKHTNYNSVLVNEKTVPGNVWFKLNAEIEKVENIGRETQELTGWKLKPEYIGKINNSTVQPKDFFDLSDSDYEDGIGKNAEWFDFYESMTQTKPPVNTPVVYEVEKFNITEPPPERFKYAVTYKIPEIFETHEYLYYSLPCFITPKGLFDLAIQVIESRPKDSKVLYSDYKSLGFFDLRVRVKVDFPWKTLQYRNMKSQKQTMEQVHSILVPVLSMGCDPKYLSDREPIQRIDGENYLDLEEKIDQWLERLNGIIKDAEKLAEARVCKNCKGTGFCA